MNNDLISREALRKALKSDCDICNSKNTNWCEHRCPLNDFEDLIDNAPTVDISGSGFFPYRTAFFNGVRAGRATARTQGEWIPVSERLPDNRDWCLGLFKEPDTDFIGIPYVCDYVGEVTKGTTNEGWILSHCTDVDNVSDYFRNIICVAWQPLPKSYKEEGAE